MFYRRLLSNHCVSEKEIQVDERTNPERNEYIPSYPFRTRLLHAYKDIYASQSTTQKTFHSVVNPRTC